MIQNKSVFSLLSLFFFPNINFFGKKETIFKQKDIFVLPKRQMERKNLDIVNKPTVEIFFLPERQKFL